MIGKPEVFKWLAHRGGKEQLQKLPPQLQYKRKALELNKKGEFLVQTFGQREIRGFVGFIDLVGFSERVKGWKSRKISEYLKPFLSSVIEIVINRYALVDKTIGDEVMFVLPDMEDDVGLPTVILMGQLLGGLYILQKDLGADYPFRIGLTYGQLYVDQIKGEGYSEWTTVGEVVHLAKRLQGLEEINTASGIGGAFGVLFRESDAVRRFESILNVIAGPTSYMTYKLIKQPVENLKGVSSSRCALLVPRN